MVSSIARGPVRVTPLDQGAAFDVEVRSPGEATGLSVVLDRVQFTAFVDDCTDALERTDPQRLREQASHVERGRG